MRRTLTEMKARGEPMTVAEIVPPAVPDEQNAALEINKAFALLGGKPAGQNVSGKTPANLKELLVALNKFYPRMKEAPPAEIKKYLEIADSPEFDEIYSLLQAAARKSGYNQNLKYEEGPAMIMPGMGSFRLAIRILSLKALALAEKNDLAGAGDMLLAALKISNHLRDEPVLISCLVRTACLKITAATIENIAENRGFPDETARKLMAELERSDTALHLKKSLVGERVVFGGVIYEGLVSGKGPYKLDYGTVKNLAADENKLSIVFKYLVSKLLIKKDYCEYLKLMAAYSKACDRPYYLAKDNEIRRIASGLENIPRYFFIARLLGPNVIMVFEQNAEANTILAISRLKLALGIYQARHNSFPDSLDQLKPAILKEVPPDALTGQALTYKREGDKYVLYSDAARNMEEKRRQEREADRKKSGAAK